ARSNNKPVIDDEDTSCAHGINAFPSRALFNFVRSNPAEAARPGNKNQFRIGVNDILGRNLSLTAVNVRWEWEHVNPSGNIDAFGFPSSGWNQWMSPFFKINPRSAAERAT